MGKELYLQFTINQTDKKGHLIDYTIHERGNIPNGFSCLLEKELCKVLKSQELEFPLVLELKMECQQDGKR